MGINFCRRQNAVMKKQFNVRSLLPYGEIWILHHKWCECKKQTKHRALCIWMRWQNPTYNAFAKRFVRAVSSEDSTQCYRTHNKWRRKIERNIWIYIFRENKIEIGIEKHSKKSATGNHFDLIKTRAVLTVHTTGNAFSFSGSVEWSRPNRMTAA